MAITAEVPVAGNTAREYALLFRVKQDGSDAQPGAVPAGAVTSSASCPGVPNPRRVEQAAAGASREAA